MRQRNLSPRFFSDEDLVDLPHTTRLLFAGLWCLSDRAGRFHDRPRRIRVELHLGDVDVDEALSQLEACDKIVRYEVDGARYGFVCGFAKNQHVHPNESPSTLPPPPQTSIGAPIGSPMGVPIGSPVGVPIGHPMPGGISGLRNIRPSETSPATTVSGDTTAGLSMVAVYVAACQASGSDPTPREKGRVGRDAKRLLELGKDRSAIDWALGEIARRNTPHLLLQLVGDRERDLAGANRGVIRPLSENPLDRRIREFGNGLRPSA